MQRRNSNGGTTTAQRGDAEARRTQRVLKRSIGRSVDELCLGGTAARDASVTWTLPLSVDAVPSGSSQDTRLVERQALRACSPPRLCVSALSSCRLVEQLPFGSCNGWAAVPESGSAASDLPNDVLARDAEEILARIDVFVLLGAILPLVELAVAAAEGDELVVRPALDDLAVLEDEDLIGALDRRQAVGDHERRSTTAQGAQAVADHRLALAVEARRGFVENEDSRVGEDRAGDGDALALAARELDAPLADDGVVALLEAIDE